MSIYNLKYQSKKDLEEGIYVGVTSDDYTEKLLSDSNRYEIQNTPLYDDATEPNEIGACDITLYKLADLICCTISDFQFSTVNATTSQWLTGNVIPPGFRIFNSSEVMLGTVWIKPGDTGDTGYEVVVTANDSSDDDATSIEFSLVNDDALENGKSYVIGGRGDEMVFFWTGVSE